MSLDVIGFFLLALVTLAGAVGGVTLKNVSHAVLSLVVLFTGIAGLFFTMHAEFAGVIQLLVYVGAVAVLIVFAIVLTRARDAERSAMEAQKKGLGFFAGAMVAINVGAVLVGMLLLKPIGPKAIPAAPTGTVEKVGESMMTTWVLPFEVASVLLTAALVGAVILAIEDKKSGAAR